MAGIFAATVFIFVVLFAELPKAVTISVIIGNHTCQKIWATRSVQYIGRDFQCSGEVTHQICGGYCLSSQIPVLNSFESDHPVCAYAGQQEVQRCINWNCPSGSNLPRECINFKEPTKCECSVCDSSHAFCGFKYKRTMNTHARSQPSSRRIYIPKSVAESKKRREWAFESRPSIYLI